MKLRAKTILTILLGGFVLVSLGVLVAKSSGPAIEAPPAAKPGAAQTEKDHVRVTYFHGTARCPTCIKLERYAHDALTSAFAAELAQGTLEWQVVNTDEAANRHYIDDYQLYTKSLIVAEVKGGKTVRWKNLEKIWDLVGNPAEYSLYVSDEVRAYLRGR